MHRSCVVSYKPKSLRNGIPWSKPVYGLWHHLALKRIKWNQFYQGNIFFALAENSTLWPQVHGCHSSCIHQYCEWRNSSLCFPKISLLLHTVHKMWTSQVQSVTPPGIKGSYCWCLKLLKTLLCIKQQTTTCRVALAEYRFFWLVPGNYCLVYLYLQMEDTEPSSHFSLLSDHLSFYIDIN